MKKVKNKNVGDTVTDDGYIDKTEVLEKGIRISPSIFLEGAAASGKSTAVKMLIGKHPEVSIFSINMEEITDDSMLREQLETAGKQMEKSAVWIILENINTVLPESVQREVEVFIRGLPDSGRVILVSREKPFSGLLDLFWKKKLQVVPQRAFLFSKEEIAGLCKRVQSKLDPKEVYEVTGGWPGCVTAMLSLTENETWEQDVTARQLRDRYEIDGYVSHTILGSLTGEEKEIMRRASVCPWLNEKLMQEVWELPWAADSLKNLERKGFLIADRKREKWKAAPLFACLDKHDESAPFWKRMGDWYETNGFIREALICLQISADEKMLRDCLLRNFSMVPFLDIDYVQVMEWKDNSPQACYLRGMHCYFSKNIPGIDRELRRMEKQQPFTEISREIYLNLAYAKPDLSLDEWLEMLESLGEIHSPVHLYNISGGSCRPLCGLRDLSGMFTGSKKEENRKRNIWKEHLDKEAYIWLSLARTDYYIEIGQEKIVSETDKNLIYSGPAVQYESGEQIRLARLSILYQLWNISRADQYLPFIRELEGELLQSNNKDIIRKMETVRISDFTGYRDSNEVLQWIRETGLYPGKEINENNYIIFSGLGKAYMMMRQYDKAERIFEKLLPYLREFYKFRVLAEALFEQAIISWEKDSHSQSLRYIIESFIGSSNYRYVRLYADYGNSGWKVLDAYVEWVSKNSPEGWHRKKKYNYGNVRRMPQEDYLELLVRVAKRQAPGVHETAGSYTEEHLTMMETLILRDINSGKSNAQICQELNLKLSTVKSHIYSLYKKLGVNSRVQATLKGKELGILK